MIGSATTEGSSFTGTALRWPLASMWLSSRQAYSLVRSHLSVHEAFV